MTLRRSSLPNCCCSLSTSQTFVSSGRLTHKLPKCVERKCGKEWVLSKIKQSKRGRLIKLRY